MMTGTCMIVRDAPVIHGMNPNRVMPRKMDIALRTPVMTIFRVLSCTMVLQLSVVVEPYFTTNHPNVNLLAGRMAHSLTSDLIFPTIASRWILLSN